MTLWGKDDGGGTFVLSPSAVVGTWAWCGFASLAKTWGSLRAMWRRLLRPGGVAPYRELSGPCRARVYGICIVFS